MPDKNLQQRLLLLGRLSSVTEELESIVKESGDIDKGKLAATTAPYLKKANEAKRGECNGPLLQQVCQDVVFHCLSAGRLRSEIYIAGKTIGLIQPVKNIRDFKAACDTIGLKDVRYEKRSQGRIRIEVGKTMTHALTSKAKSAVCYFEAGFLSGVLEIWDKLKVDLREVSCAVASGKICKFSTVDPEDIETLDLSHFTGSLPLLPIEQYSEENIRLLTSLAAHALTAIENSLLFEKTKRQTILDNLTGLYNHRYFQQSLKIELKRSIRHREPLALLMIDIDRFKSINDTCGHVKGDKVLKLVGRILSRCVREIDVVARYGGDEFCIILPQTNETGAVIVGRRIHDAFKNNRFIQSQGRNIPVSVGIGLACNEAGAREPMALIETADKALIHAKRKGLARLLVAKSAKHISK